MTSPKGVSFDSVEDLIPRAEIFRSKLIEDFQLLDSINKTTTEVLKYYSSELSGKPALYDTVQNHYNKTELRLLREFLSLYFAALVCFDFKYVSSARSTKLTLEILEKGVKYVMVILLLTLNVFHTFFWCFYC